MISVIIPALNEERTIGKVVQFLKKMQSVDEIIAVDDKSIDDTVQVAKDAGASVITSTKLGKGASMRDGFLVSKNEIIVFLDGDIENYPPETIEKLTAPVIKDEADLVKATFEREAGRVTELVAKPLLSLLFPQINHFSQPLSGIIAIKRELFKKLTLEDNYGVDIGILLDAALTFGFKEELVNIIKKNYESFLITKLIAGLFKGKNIAHLLNVVEDIPIVPDVIDVTKELKNRGYIVGIISDSYDCIANHIKNKIGADFALANELEFSQSIATGEIKIPSFFARTDKSQCNHTFCKSNAMLQVANQYGIELSNTIAVGDSEYDICMVSFAGIGVSFCSNNIVLNNIADQIIGTKSFKPILDFAI